MRRGARSPHPAKPLIRQPPHRRPSWLRVYFLIRAIVLQLGMDANDMKLISAVIVALALCIPVVWEKYQLRRAYARSAKAAPATPAANSEGGR